MPQGALWGGEGEGAGEGAAPGWDAPSEPGPSGG